MALTADSVRAALRQHILHDYLFSDDPAALGDDDSFQETRQIDSMGMMQLIPFIERTFDITIGEADLVPERLDSINRLVALVMDKRGQARPAGESVTPAAGDAGGANDAAAANQAPAMNDAPAEDTPASLVHLLARSAADHAERPALVGRDGAVTYANLWSAVRRGVGGLRASGVRPGDRVALLATHTADTVAAYYAILAAGAVVVPLDPRARPRELAARLAHTDARLLVVDGLPDVDLAAVGASDRAIDVAALLQGSEAVVDLSRSKAQDLAALVFTSGTVAEPRAVMLSHRNLVSNTLAVIAYLELTPGDSVMSPLPMFYAYGASVVHTHLATGASVVLGDMRYAERTLEWMIEARVTGFSGVAWMLTFLLDRTTLRTAASRLPALRYVTQAGSRMPAADIARLTAALPGVRFFAMYGQTEATSRLTYLPPDDVAHCPTSVGRPIEGVTIEIRRPDGSRAAADETGEIVASGPGIMLGYWRQPDATARVITVDDRGRWLHTGDLGHVDTRGRLHIDGRQSEMIKVCGHRINPAEIEEVVRLLGGVEDAAAVGVPNGSMDDAIHLHIVRARPSLNEADVLAHCRRHLSLHKIPRRILFTDALPRTASGKTQRRRLAASSGVAS